MKKNIINNGSIKGEPINGNPAKNNPAKNNSVKDSSVSEKCEKLYNSITNINERYIEEAQRQKLPAFAKTQDAKKRWFSLRRAAAVIISVLVLGSATAVAASPALRSAIIRFLSGGEMNKIPLDLLEPTAIPDQPSPGSFSPEQFPAGAASTETLSTEEASVGSVPVEPGVPMALGDITFLQGRTTNEHFTATYISSPDWLEAHRTPSGRLLFSTHDSESDGKTYYQLIDGKLELSTPESHHLEGSVLLQNLSGVMSHGGSTEYASVTLPEMIFQVDWQQLGEDILILDTDASSRFDIGSTFGGTKDGASIEGMYDGRFSVTPLKGETEWVQVSFLFDSQLTEYSYPFLFSLRTGETADPLAGIDLSAYPCVTYLTICDGKKSATAMAGDSHDGLREIFIDLESGNITQETRLDPPVSSCLYSLTTSDHTVFYALGDEQHADGYLYDTETQTSKTLFRGAAWGYMWDYGFSDTYIRLIGGNHAVYYREPENEVYLVNLADGEMHLLESIPASHDVSFFWNNERTLLSISMKTADAASRLAFYLPGAENAWYFDWELPERIRENYGSWYSEYGHLISAVSEDDDRHYLFLYQYIP